MTVVDVWASVVFYVAAIVATVAGLKMVSSRDMVRSALWLVVALGSVAVIFLLLSADFLAVVQVLIYVGAISILLLFAIMLTPGQVELPAVAERGQRASAAIVALLIGATALFSLLSHPWNVRSTPLDTTTTRQIGELLMGTYVLPFEIASVLLTAALIGAIVIAREE